jgi:hypothetical protein
MTIMFSRPGVCFNVSNETTDGNFATNSTSTMYPEWPFLCARLVVVLMSLAPREVVRVTRTCNAGQPRDARWVRIGGIEQHRVADAHLVSHEIARLVIPHALPARDVIAREIVNGVGGGLAFHQPVLHR